MALNKGVFFRAKNVKFDKAAIVKAVGKAEAKVMSRKGALVKTIAQRSMRKRKKASKDGDPPSVHKGQLKRELYSAYDPKTRSAVIGPIKLGAGIAPHALEYTGESVVRERVFRNRAGEVTPLRLVKSEYARRKLIESGKVFVRFRAIKFAPRPFMNPALKAAAPYLAREWKGKVKK